MTSPTLLRFARGAVKRSRKATVGTPTILKGSSARGATFLTLAGREGAPKSNA